MNFLDAFLVSLSMSIDASTVNVVNGLEDKDMKLGKMIFISFIFGLFQFLMPVIGYFIGFSLKEYLETYIPWIAFTLLLALGIKSFIDWIKDFRNKEEVKEKKLTLINILVQGIATSIDALCVGFVFLDYTFFDAMMTFILIGVVTFIMSFLAVFLSKKVAGKLTRWAGLIASIVFVALAIKMILSAYL